MGKREHTAVRGWPFKPSKLVTDAERLLALVSSAARDPAIFEPDCVPDTLAGRFEVLALFAAQALIRLNGVPGSQALAQAFVDKVFRSLDAGLRETGVGDTVVSKRMHSLAGDFYGRLNAYASALEAGRGDAIRDALSRNISGLGLKGRDVLATRAQALYARLKNGGVEAMLNPDTWAAAPTFGVGVGGD